MKTERIDGNDYVIGTPDHLAATRARQTRLDDAYFQANHAQFERNVRLLEGAIRTDSNGTALLARDLLFLRPELERRLYATLRAAEFVPVDITVPRGAETVATRIIDRTGTAKISHVLAGDSPRVDVSVTEDTAKLVNIMASYAYSIEDLERAAYARMPLTREKAYAASDAIARALNRIALSGTASDPEGDIGLRGLFNNANVTLHTLTNGEWPTATPAEILADLAELEALMISQSADTITGPVTLILPTTYERRLRTLMIGIPSDRTVAEHFLANSALVKSIVRLQDLDNAVAPDIAASDAPMAVLVEVSPEVLKWPVPISYEELPPQIKGYEWTVNCRARCGGVDVRRPYRMLYAQNID